MCASEFKSRDVINDFFLIIFQMKDGRTAIHVLLGRQLKHFIK